MAYVTGLMFALSRVILAVLLGTMSPNTIGFKIKRQRGKIRFTQSAKLREIPPRKLRRGGMSDTIGVDILAMCDKKHGI